MPPKADEPLMPCRHCGQYHRRLEANCPHCGEPVQPVPWLQESQPEPPPMRVMYGPPPYLSRVSSFPFVSLALVIGTILILMAIFVLIWTRAGTESNDARPPRPLPERTID